MGKLINRIPGSRLLISSLPGLALRTHVESLGKPRDAFSKPCLVNLISKDTHLVFSISLQFHQVSIYLISILQSFYRKRESYVALYVCKLTLVQRGGGGGAGACSLGKNERNDTI